MATVIASRYRHDCGPSRGWRGEARSCLFPGSLADASPADMALSAARGTHLPPPVDPAYRLNRDESATEMRQRRNDSSTVGDASIRRIGQSRSERCHRVRWTAKVASMASTRAHLLLPAGLGLLSLGLLLPR